MKCIEKIRRCPGLKDYDIMVLVQWFQRVAMTSPLNVLPRIYHVLLRHLNIRISNILFQIQIFIRPNFTNRQK